MSARPDQPPGVPATFAPSARVTHAGVPGAGAPGAPVEPAPVQPAFPGWPPPAASGAAASRAGRTAAFLADTEDRQPGAADAPRAAVDSPAAASADQADARATGDIPETTSASVPGAACTPEAGVDTTSGEAGTSLDADRRPPKATEPAGPGAGPTGPADGTPGADFGQGGHGGGRAAAVPHPAARPRGGGAPDAPPLDAQDRARLLTGAHHDPHALLGAHPADGGVTVRVLRPYAKSVTVLADGLRAELGSEGDGLFGALLPMPWERLCDYELLIDYGTDEVRTADPYSFLPALGELDLHLISEGRHEQLWHALGARPMTHAGVPGTRFTVWAPNALGVRLAGDFTFWDGTAFPMRSLGASGVWELFLPGVGEGSPVQVRDHPPGRQSHAARGPAGPPHRVPAGHGVRRALLHARVAGRGVAEPPREVHAARGADVRLRGTPALVAARADLP